MTNMTVVMNVKCRQKYMKKSENFKGCFNNQSKINKRGLCQKYFNIEAGNMPYKP